MRDLAIINPLEQSNEGRKGEKERRKGRGRGKGREEERMNERRRKIIQRGLC